MTDDAEVQAVARAICRSIYGITIAGDELFDVDGESREESTQAARAAIAALDAVRGWRDMDSAPRNGTPILAHDGEDQIVVRWGHMTWLDDTPADFGWIGAGFAYPPQGRFTHWMPLPPAPEDAP